MLRFKKNDVRNVLQWTTGSVRLVGDDGVYLISDNHLSADAPIAYAKGIDPNVDEFDDWWERKRREFGNDDGVENLPKQDIEKAVSNTKGDYVRVKVTRAAVEIIIRD